MTTAAGNPARADTGGALPSPFILAGMLLQRRRLIVGLAVGFALVAALSTLLARRTYTSEASFTPAASESSASRASGIAAQFGLSIATGSSEYSPPFYADLVLTRTILGPLLAAQYSLHVGDVGLTATLAELYELGELPPPVQVERGLTTLRKHISASPALRTGVVTVRVTTEWPEVSEDLVSKILAGVSEFNLTKRQSQAAAQRDFARDRLAAASAELREAEGRQLAFLEANRTYSNSPVLRFEQDRLARAVAVKQQVFASLSQAFEQARIDAVRDTPVITIIESGRRAALPDSRRLLTKTALAFLLGLALGVVAMVVLSLLERARADDPLSYAEFGRMRAEARADIRRLTFGLWPH